MANFNASVHLSKIFSDRWKETCLLSLEGQTLSYGEVYADIGFTSSRLADLGLAAGEEIVILAENSLKLARLLLGAWQAGLVVTPLNPDLSDSQLRVILSKINPKKIFYAELALRESTLDLINEYKTCDLENMVFTQKSVLKSQASETGKHSISVFETSASNQVFMRVFTSGSTSAPKGVEVSLNSLVGNEILFATTMGVTPENRFYNFFPMSYLAGTHNTLLLPIAMGASVVIGPVLAGRSMFTFWSDVQTLKINTLWFTGAMLSMILQIRPDDDEKWISQQIKLGLVGMAPLDLNVKKEFEDRFGFTLYENYGLSETTFISSHPPGEKTDLRSKGKILDGVNVKIVDEGHDIISIASKTNPGEIFVSTPYMMVDYFKANENDKKNIADNGFYTGDLGYVENNELYIIGRQKDLIIRGGINISPAIVEAAIYKVLPASEVSAVAVAHDVYGEEVAVAIVMRDQEGEVNISELRHLLDDELAQFQKPTKVIFSPSLPRGMTGKIDKKAIKKLFKISDH